MRSQEEIINHYKEIQEGDWCGFQAGVLLSFLTANNVRQFCKFDADLSDWKPDEMSDEYILSRMHNYMEFAWGKVENHRGISAGRSVDKMTEWVWLLGRDDIVKAIENAEYQNYGAPKLKVICDAFILPVPATTSIQNMIQGLPCVPGCDQGCGK